VSWYDVDEVLLKAELPEVARRLGMDVERRGANLVTQCPFHEDTRPSLVLYPRDASRPSHFHCFSCNAHGYAVDLVKRVEGKEFKPAIEWLARGLGIAPKRTTAKRSSAKQSAPDDALSFARRVFDQQHDEASFVDWCQIRGFDRNFLYGLGLRCLPPGSALVRALQSEGFGAQQELIDGLLSAGLLMRLRPETTTIAQASLNLNEQFRDYFYDGRVLIPILSEKKDVIGFAGRHRPTSRSNGVADNLTAKYLLTPGFRKAEVLFNAFQAVQTMRAAAQAGESHMVLYVVEGFLDALRLQALELPAVAVMGTSLSEKQRAGLSRLIESAKLPGGAHVSLRLFFDRDGAGFDGAVRTSRQLLGMPGVATEWIGFSDHDSTLPGKDPDEILSSLGHDEAKAALDQRALPGVGLLIAASLGYKDATPLASNDRWNDISRYPRERALLQAARAMRALSATTVDWEQRLETLKEPRLQWVTDLLEVLGLRQRHGHPAKAPTAFELTFLVKQEARLNHARMLAEHGARRGELPGDEETWRALDRNAQLFNTVALDRLKQPSWQQAAPYDAVHLPRKLSGDALVLSDPRRKVMPHPADLHLQQFLMNELLTERHDFSHEGLHSYSDCIPAVRWFGTEGEVRVTGYVAQGEPSPALHDDERGDHDEPVLSFAYQIDMDVLEGRRKPTDQGMFRPYIECWRDYMASLGRQARAIGPHVHVLRLDAKRYYDSIQRYVVRDRLLSSVEQALIIRGPEDISKLLNLATNDARDASSRLVDLLCSSLFEHEYQHPDGKSTTHSDEIIGIPQGPVISAWIGTIAMFPVDAAARAFMRQPGQRHPEDPARPRVGYARYVDDIVLLADSETGLNALREAVQAAAGRLELTLLRKGEAVAPGSPDSVMRQLNEGRAMAPSVPVWEPPMVGDGETGWGMGADDVGPMDRQSALHLLRHPSLLDDPDTVHEKVRDAMRAPDLRPSDLGKCARALWWQVTMQSLQKPASPDTDAWDVRWQAYRQRWDAVCAGHEWAPAFQRRDYDILFAVEGLDMLMDSGPSMEKGRGHIWISQHRKALDTLAKAILDAGTVLRNVPFTHNRAHIQRRARMVQWKALQRRPDDIASLYVESQQSDQLTLTEWLCQAAILLRRYGASGDTVGHPLETLLKLSESQCGQGPDDIQAACRYLKADAAGTDVKALKIALPFLVANTTDKRRWKVLSQYPTSLADGIPYSPTLAFLPPLPVERAGMLGHTTESGTFGTRLISFRRAPDEAPPNLAPGAIFSGKEANSLDPIQLPWLASEELAPGLYRQIGTQNVGLVFGEFEPTNRARFAAELYEVLYAIQRQDAGEGNEWVTVIAHLAHAPIVGPVTKVEQCEWYLVSEPVASDHLGVSAWVRDGRGGLRSLSVPGGEYAKLWRLGCAVSDALHMALDLSNEDGAADKEEGEGTLVHLHQIQDYLLRQQLSKLRGTWIADAQVRDKGDDDLPATVRRALEILRRFDPALDAAQQVRLVLHTEAETRSMAMRLQRKGPSDLRSRLHLLPALVLRRLPLSVLECLPLERDHTQGSLRTDLKLLLALAKALDNNSHGNSTNASPVEAVALDPAKALHIGVVLAAAGTALRGLVASAWGVARYRSPVALPERLSIPVGWQLLDVDRQDPQQDYDTMCKGLREDDWSGLKEATPWQWMLALLGILEAMAPQTLHATSYNPLRELYEHLRLWQSAPPEEGIAKQWSWPYDDMPVYNVDAWRSLLKILPIATLQVDQCLGFIVRQVDAPVFRRHRDDSGFTDAESQQWTLVKLQYTGLGSADSVARVQHGSRRLATWTEVRRLADDELLSIHTLDDKLGRWWDARCESAPKQAAHASETLVERSTGTPVTQNESSRTAVDPSNDDSGRQDRANVSNIQSSSAEAGIRSDVRESQLASWRDRGALKCPSHMRVALLQWRIDESYSHPLAEVGLQGMGMPDWARAELRKTLVPTSAMGKADKAAMRGREHIWPTSDAESVVSWPEHRRQRLLKRALEACNLLKVDLLVLPEVSVRRETIKWLEEELQRHYPGVAVLAGTYRHFGNSVNDQVETSGASGNIHPLMEPLTLIWRPDAKLSKALFPDPSKPPETLRFWRGKKYRAVAANELFRPDWQPLQPLFRIDRLLEQLGDLTLSPEHQKALLRAIAEQMPPLRYCMELICSELFLLTSPANIEPLRHEIAAMLQRFPGAPADDADAIVFHDYRAVGKALSVVQEHSTPRRTVLLVPAATKRSNDYWHAGQASVLASGTATVFCNAARWRAPVTVIRRSQTLPSCEGLSTSVPRATAV
jgi:DNA primase catalytic core